MLLIQLFVYVLYMCSMKDLQLFISLCELLLQNSKKLTKYLIVKTLKLK